MKSRHTLSTMASAILTCTTGTGAKNHRVSPGVQLGLAKKLRSRATGEGSLPMDRFRLRSGVHWGVSEATKVETVARVGELRAAIPEARQARITMAVGTGQDPPA